MAKKLTRSILNKLINEEKLKLLEALEQGAKSPEAAAKKTREVDADKMADTLASDLDHYKAMKIHEEKLVKQLKSIREAKARLKKRLLSNID